MRIIEGGARGQISTKSCLGIPKNGAPLKITGQIRRIISVTVARANAEALLSRTDQIGRGTRAANKRRQWALYEDGRMRNERIASWISKEGG